MNEDDIQKIVENLGNLMAELDAVLLIYTDTTQLKDHKVKEINKKVEDGLKQMDIGRFLQSDNQLFMDINFYNNQFDHLLLNSLFITSFASFENCFKKLASISEGSISSLIKVSNIRGNGILDIQRRYLFLVHNIVSADDKSILWNEILHFKAIRNAIVHNESVLKKPKNSNWDSEKGYSKIIKHEIKFFKDKGKFTLNQISFIKDFSSISQKYITEITKELLNKYNSEKV